MIERIGISLGLIVVFVFGYWLFQQWQRWQINGRLHTTTLPQLLYFGSESCAACPAQARYIGKISEKWDSQLTIRKVDVDLEPETAVQYRVMSLPTTMLLSKDGAVHSINYGLTNSQKLNAQIEQLAL
ncbi:MAG: thioredoxin family protein [Chloroflexota bacterium]